MTVVGNAPTVIGNSMFALIKIIRQDFDGDFFAGRNEPEYGSRHPPGLFLIRYRLPVTNRRGCIIDFECCTTCGRG